MPKPPRTEVLPSPNTSQAKPTRGPKLWGLPLPNVLAGAKPPGPQMPANCANRTSCPVAALQPGLPATILALPIQPRTLLPGPGINVVAALASSVCRLYRSYRIPRFRVRRLDTFQSSWKNAPISRFRQRRTLVDNCADGIGLNELEGHGGLQIPGSTPATCRYGASAAKNTWS